MNRKQRERANAKYDAGLGKKLRHSDMEDWGALFDESLHHIAKTNLIVATAGGGDE